MLQQPRQCIRCTDETYRMEWETHAKEPMTHKDIPEKPVSGFLSVEDLQGEKRNMSELQKKSIRRYG